MSGKFPEFVAAQDSYMIGFQNTSTATAAAAVAATAASSF